MPIEFFYCPDGPTIAVSECLQKGGCRMVNEGLTYRRCAPRAILQESIKERRYEGHVSVTGMEKDALFHWLKEKVVYGVDPLESAARYIGNAAHYLMEKNPAPDTQPEVKVYHDLYSGTSDLVSIDEWTGEYFLTDLKTRSCFRYANMIGLKRSRYLTRRVRCTSVAVLAKTALPTIRASLSWWMSGRLSRLRRIWTMRFASATTTGWRGSLLVTR